MLLQLGDVDWLLLVLAVQGKEHVGSSTVDGQLQHALPRQRTGLSEGGAPAPWRLGANVVARESMVEMRGIAKSFDLGGGRI